MDVIIAAALHILEWQEQSGSHAMPFRARQLYRAGRKSPETSALEHATEKITDILMSELSALPRPERKKRIKALEETAHRIVSESRARRQEPVRK